MPGWRAQEHEKLNEIVKSIQGIKVEINKKEE